MKKIFTLAAFFVFGILQSKAQPNGGFENWTTEYTFESPDGWQTLNFLSLLIPPNPVSAFKVIGSDVHSGFYALKLKTICVTNNPYTLLIADTTSGVFTGKIIYSPPSYNYGFSYTGRPEKLEFWYKYSPVGADTAGAGIATTKWNGTSRDTIATGLVKILSATQYTLVQVQLNYQSNEQPDTAVIAFRSSKDSANARVGSTLFLDDVAFTGWVGIDEQNIFTEKVRVFPNPAKGELNIQTQFEKAEKIRVTDSSGNLTGSYLFKNKSICINTSLFTAGIYFYEILDKKGNSLSKGKFNVIK